MLYGCHCFLCSARLCNGFPWGCTRRPFGEEASEAFEAFEGEGSKEGGREGVNYTFRAFLIARITCVSVCTQGSSTVEHLDFSRIAVKRDISVFVCLYALRGFTHLSYILMW